MGFNTGAIRRQDVDIFDQIAYGFSTATVGAILNGAAATISVNVPGVGVSTTQPWAQLAFWTSAALGNLVVDARIASANTVTLVIHNNSGGTITPPASTAYGVVFGRLNQRYTTPNTPGGTTG